VANAIPPASGASQGSYFVLSLATCFEAAPVTAKEAFFLFWLHEGQKIT
jgi:hypothetical protein